MSRKRPAPDWKQGDRLTHRLNPEMGAGQIVETDGRSVVVYFPMEDQTLRMAANDSALLPWKVEVGARVIRADNGEMATVRDLPDEEGVFAVLDDEEVIEAELLWPANLGPRLGSRILSGEVDSPRKFRLRLDAMQLAQIREADGLGSFLGGRIRLFPHQLYVAERATRQPQVRWLLADEVGLGKTVESCLILNHLLHHRRAERAVVIAPDTLTVQWLGELWRKYHQVFVLLDEPRLKDVEKEYGKGFNPFDAYSSVVISHELATERPDLVRDLVDSPPDVLVVDEAHHLKRAAGHPGNELYRALAPAIEACEHTLLLTAVPLEDDAQGFFRLLQLLHPEAYPSYEQFQEQLESGDRLLPCTSATRRIDIGGLPPRTPEAIDLDEAAYSSQTALIEGIRAIETANVVQERNKAGWIQDALSSPALAATTIPAPHRDGLLPLLEPARAEDPRVEWLADQVRRWSANGDKTLVFVSRRETLDELRSTLGRKTSLKMGAFHEDLSTKQRDIEVAQFRLPGGPSLMISTECGGEGRNFEFCRRLVLFDLPWSPMLVEQRIGRLDRIGRDRPVEIVYFRPPGGIGRAASDLYERLGVFERPLGTHESELGGIEQNLTELALGQDPLLDPSIDRFDQLLARTQAARDEVQRAAYHELHRDPYDPEMADSILGRVPDNLEELTRRTVLGASYELGLHVEDHNNGRRHWIEFDARARVESLPGLPGEASFLGTFFREEAVEDETLEFFATGHVLVEGLLGHLNDSPVGRATIMRAAAESPEDRGFGLFSMIWREDSISPVAFDLKGQARPDWCERILKGDLDIQKVRVKDWTQQSAWEPMVSKILEKIEGLGEPVLLAAIRFG